MFRIERKDRTTSTNQDMENLIRQAMANGKDITEYQTIIANFQDGGRGQKGNFWHSAAGQNLLASICFHPPVSAARQFVFNEYFALAVRQVLADIIGEVKIKWPNDIYVGDKKIAGILIEHAIAGDAIRYTIAGLGLNLNETDFPADLPNPVSLSQITGEQYDILEFTDKILTSCQRFSSLLKPENRAALETEFLSHLYRINEWASFEIGGQCVEARITGVDAFGRLLLEGRAGEQWCCGMKEVRFR